MRTGVEIIQDERQRHITAEGYDANHDDTHVRGEMASAAVCYVALAANQSRCFMDFKASQIHPPQQPNLTWPWDAQYWKPSDDRIRNLARAGSLIAAEIDRITRLENK